LKHFNLSPKYLSRVINVGDFYTHAKFGANPSTGGFWTNAG